MEGKERLTSLFKYIRELFEMRRRTVSHLNNQVWFRFIDSIPQNNKYINLNYVDREEYDSDELINDESSNDGIILEVMQPTIPPCPQIPKSLIEWVQPGWENVENEVQRIDSLKGTDENFEDSLSRINDWSEWYAKRENWVAKLNELLPVRELFEELYKYYVFLNTNSESYEFIVGQGVLSENTHDNSIYHPVLLKRIRFQFDSDRNIIRVFDTDVETELYTMLFKELDYINHDAVKDLKEQIDNNFFHPLDRNETPKYLIRLINTLCPDSKYIESIDEEVSPYDKLLLYARPVLLIRKKLSGVIKAIDDIIEQIEEDEVSAGPLLNLIGEDEPNQEEQDENYYNNDQLTMLNGIHKDILLCKEANKEQLEIAEKIERNKVVLVQGPPGTGKTHTIGNLTGHFLAQGKSVLITSHTSKALKVVKDKIPSSLHSLCVSILDDTNKDMETSINGISDITAKHSSSALLERANRIKEERNQLIDELNALRKKVLRIKYKEYNPIIINGHEYSPIKAAEYVFDNSEILSSVIPGDISIDKPLPVTLDDLEALYKTNDDISIDEENELICDLPEPELFMKPIEFRDAINTLNGYMDRENEIIYKLKNEYGIEFRVFNNSVFLNDDELSKVINISGICELKSFLQDISKVDEWLIQAIIDCRKGEGYKAIWVKLIKEIRDTAEYAENTAALLFGKQIDSTKNIEHDKAKRTLLEIGEHLEKGKKLSKVVCVLHKTWDDIISNFTINGEAISSKSDCDIISKYIELQEKRRKLNIQWDELIAKNGGTEFSELGDEPERYCIKQVDRILGHINWENDVYQVLLSKMNYVGVNSTVVFQREEYFSDDIELREKIKIIDYQLPLLIELIEISFNKIKAIETEKQKAVFVLNSEQLKGSLHCRKLACAIDSNDVISYEKCYGDYIKLYNKYSIQKERKRILESIEFYAPEWANQISKRIGIHGMNTRPENITKAWEWKQLNSIISEITSEPFEKLQKDIERVRCLLRENTTKLIKLMAWYHLLKRIENDREKQQALLGWKLTIKKIGKGTGKNAPKLKKQAQGLMSKCQDAVPAWIMTINKALESLNPKTNKFDVVIIDEASQSDISSLAIMYLAKKVIVVGDDEQVSPAGVGVDITKTNALVKEYIEGVIPNYHLYDVKTSLYDIIRTTYKQTMLKEHFRCVPDIIGYSNWLSYNGAIKPLRDNSSSILKPATTTFRVDGIREENKTNELEARNIVALMLACFEQPEYKGMTFGAITLLGNQQDVLINDIALKKIPVKEFEKRNILCGTASHFQGDERDVVFLSMVDSNLSGTPLRLISESGRRATKQSYNVAASRARNQLWVIHSLDVSKDLKYGDMRKDLIEYMANPKNLAKSFDEVDKRSESPFEKSVGKALVAAGYHISQQWPVGSYRIDIVVLYNDDKVAIECDGEKFHSGEDKIREDLERQVILERLGWRFIRIRGSEYYRNPDETMKRVFDELSDMDILPEGMESEPANEDNELLTRVKLRASQILNEWSNDKKLVNIPRNISTSSIKTNEQLKTQEQELKSKVLRYENRESCHEKVKPKEKYETNKVRKNVQEKRVQQLEVKPKHEVVKQLSFTIEEKENEKDAENIIMRFRKFGLDVIDNREQSGIIWVLYKKDFQKQVVEIAEPEYRIALEKRGARATGNKPAWRIMKK